MAGTGSSDFLFPFFFLKIFALSSYGILSGYKFIVRLLKSHAMQIEIMGGTKNEQRIALWMRVDDVLSLLF